MNPRLRHALPWLVVAVLGLFAKCTYDGRRRAEGREAVALEQRRVAEKQLLAARTRVDTVYRVDTARLWRTVTRTETLLDTLLKSDTIVLTKRESVLVFVADSLIGQCRAAVLTCEARVRVRDSLNAVLLQDRNYWRGRSSPSLLTRLSTASKWLAIGFVIGAIR